MFSAVCLLQRDYQAVYTYTPFLEKIDLTYTQYIAMMVLWEKKQISVKELGKCLFLDSGTLTPLLKKLEQKGYVTRTRSEEDERVLIAAITPKGEDLKDEAVLIPQKMMACAALPQEKAAQLYTLLYELLNTLEKIESKLKKGGKPYCYSFSRP